MCKSIFLRILVTTVGTAIVAAGVTIGIEVAVRVLGIIRFDHVPRGELVIKETRQQRIPKGKTPTKFNRVQRSGEDVVIVGDLDSITSEKLVLRRTAQFDVYSTEMFGISGKAYQIVPSLAGFYTIRVIGSLMSLVVGGVLLGVARDLWLMDAIVSGRKKSWMF